MVWRLAVGPIVTWALSLLLAILALSLRDAIVFPLRGVAVPAIIFVGLASAILLRRHRSSWLLLAAAGIAGWQGLAPRLDARAVWADAALARVAGSHFVVGYTDVAEVRDLSRAGLIGGVFLTRRNVQGRTAAEVAAEVAGLQEVRRREKLPPLIVSADQEGGTVTHLSPPLPPLPALSRLAKQPGSERREDARREGEAAGRALAGLGVTMDLAPVVDLRPAAAPEALDLHTRIATRAISGDPVAVAEVASGFAEGLREAGVVPTAKHFPGLGSVTADTHLRGAALTRPRAALAERDWVPFRALLAVPGTAVLLSHATLEAVDPGVPSSQSRPVVEGLLRGSWSFDGLAVTDDLTMGAVVHAGLCDAVAGALNAGVDLLLVSWDTDRVYPALRCAAEAVRAGRIDRDMLARSDARLERFRPRPGRRAGAG